MNPRDAASIQALCQQAIALHQRGNLAETERLCGQILALDRNNSLAYNLLGVLRSQQGRDAEALALLETAIKSNPPVPGLLSNYGLILQKVGRLHEALQTFDRAIALEPRLVGAIYNRGNTLRLLKRHADALRDFNAVLNAAPNHFEAEYHRAVTLRELGRFDEALVSLDKTLALNPTFVFAHDSRGSVLRDLRRWDEAIAAYDRALAVDPKLSGTHFNRAITLADAQRHREALAGFDRAIALKPDFATAFSARGTSLRDLGELDAALASYDRALAISPTLVTAVYDRANLLGFMRRFDEALAGYDQAIALDPQFAQAHYNRGITLFDLQRLEDAIASYDRAIAARPDYAQAWNNRGSILWALKRSEEALASFDKAITYDPNYAEALSNRANIAWMEHGRYDEAVRDLERLVAINPEHPYALGDLLHLRMHGGDWRGFDEQVAALQAGVRAGKPVARPFMYQAISESPADLAACSALHAAREFSPQAPLWHARARSSDKIRLAYFSGEFRQQATSYLAVGLYERHDKSKFELIAFDNGRSDDSQIRRRIEGAFDRIIDISTLSDAAAAQAVAEADIDILVNLNGYFGRARMGLFARKPAALQVNYLGFPATLGADYIDYIIADPTVIPENEQKHYREKVVYLPDSYQVNDRERRISERATTRAEWSLPEEALVFCNFNQSYKLTPPTFAAWMRIMRAVDGSVLWLLEDNPRFAERLRAAAEAQGIAGQRLVFAPHVPMEEHLARLGLADLFLDSLPYNAHTTASDALWAGLPLVTCRGTAFPGRVAASLLEAVGLPELVTGSWEEYEALALRIAREPEQRKALCAKLAVNRMNQPLFDTDRFRRNIESAFITMHQMRLNGEPARGFAVMP